MTTAGWYPNPSGAPGMRYWDGAAWRDAVVTPPAALGDWQDLFTYENVRAKPGRTNWAALITITVVGLVAAVIAVAGILGSHTKPSASPIPPGASSQDVAFLRAMDERGLSNSDGPRAEIAAAHDVCRLLGQGYSINGLAEHFTVTNKSGMSSDSMHDFIQTAAATYCPEHVQ